MFQVFKIIVISPPPQKKKKRGRIKCQKNVSLSHFSPPFSPRRGRSSRHWRSRVTWHEFHLWCLMLKDTLETPTFEKDGKYTKG